MSDHEQSKASWDKWKEHPSPENLATVLHHVQPVLDKAVAGHPNVNKGLLGGQAKQLAVQAIKTYDPASGANLHTHVFNHLLPLGRQSQELTRIINLPRNARDDASHFKKGMSDFYEENNREPNDAEIQDLFGLDKRGLKRLHRITRYEFPEGQLEESPNVQQEDPKLALWIDYVYHDLDPMGKAIMDHKMGRNGRPILSSPEVAAKLKIDPTYVNRRAANISKQILDGLNQTREANPNE